MDFFFKKPPPWPIFIFWEGPFFWFTLYLHSIFDEVFFYLLHVSFYPLLTYSWWPSMEIVRIINHKKSSNISLQSSAKLVSSPTFGKTGNRSLIFCKECLLRIVLLLTWCAYPSEVQLKVYSISCTTVIPQTILHPNLFLFITWNYSPVLRMTNWEVRPRVQDTPCSIQCVLLLR